MPSYYYTKFQKNPCVGRNERCPLICALIFWRSGLGLLMGKIHQSLTELSARDTIMTGYYHFAFSL